MKRQHLVLLPAAGVILAAMVGVLLFIRGSAERAMSLRGSRAEAFGSVSLPLSPAFQPTTTTTNRAWVLREFQARGVGTLLLASEPLDGSAFDAACLRWFSLPSWPPGSLNYFGGGRDRFFKPLPLFRQGAFEMHKDGKSLRMAACFDQGGHRHWMELRTAHGFLPEQKVFDALLLSLRDGEGQGPGPGLEPALAAIPGETSHRFLLPEEVLLAFPLLLVLLPAGVLWAVGRRAGRPPEGLAGTLPAAYCRPFAEVGLVGGGQWKFFSACVMAVDGELKVYTFGSPFLRLPREAHPGRVKTVRGWIRPPYLELPLDPPAEFLKRRWLYGLTPGRFRLRVYIPDPDILRAALGG